MAVELPELRLLADMDALRVEFYRHYDPSRHLAVGEDILAGKFRRTECFLGEGRHFRAWKVLVGSDSNQVLTLSNETFVAERGTGGIQRWLNNMKTLQSANLLLVPPFAIQQVGTAITLMMPFGNHVQSALNPHWLPLAAHKEQLAKKLLALRLVIDDHLQIKVSGGIPFVCDFSDLQTSF